MRNILGSTWWHLPASYGSACMWWGLTLQTKTCKPLSDTWKSSTRTIVWIPDILISTPSGFFRTRRGWNWKAKLHKSKNLADHFWVSGKSCTMRSCEYTNWFWFISSSMSSLKTSWTTTRKKSTWVTLLQQKRNIFCERILNNLCWNPSTTFSVSGSQEAAAFKTTCFNMAHIHSVLWEHFQGEDLPVTLFTITSKLHWMMHSALLASYISPRRVWCFKGEDFMKCTQLLAASCVSGNSLVTSTLKMLQHWRVAFHLQWAESSWASWQITKKKRKKGQSLELVTPVVVLTALLWELVES